jgi:hypothetical protein
MKILNEEESSHNEEEDNMDEGDKINHPFG